MRKIDPRSRDPAVPPRWLRPINADVTDALGYRIDPALRVDQRIAALLEADAHGLIAEVTPFMTSNYDTVLAAEIVVRGIENPFFLVRAATGDEAAYLLDSEDGDEPPSADTTIVWRERRDSPERHEPAVLLWSGEVLLMTGRGLAGPFYTHRQVAKAWAFSTALGLPEAEVFGAQTVCYLCAASQAVALLIDGQTAFDRLNRCSVPAIRSASIVPFALPGRDAADV